MQELSSGTVGNGADLKTTVVGGILQIKADGSVKEILNI